MKRRNERNSGFTLLETLVTVAVLVILLGLSLVGVARWRDPLKITELDNEAREIYMAAENRAVLLQNSGEADELLASLVKSGSTTTVTTTGPDGIDEPKTLVLLSYKKDVTNPPELESLIPTGTIDPYLWEGQFHVLYDADTLHVYEVFYAEKEFDAAKLNELRQDKDTRIKLYRDKNVECLVGHYDNGLADKIATKPLPAPGVEVIIENGNQLLLTVKYTMPKEEDLPSGVNMGDVKREANVTLKYGETEVKLLYVEGEKIESPHNARLTDETKNSNIANTPAAMTTTYTWVLDSLDYEKNGVEVSQRFKGLFEDMPEALGGDFTVTASLRLSAEGCIESFYSAEDSDNSLFDTSTKDGTTAYIANLRHLQNLDNTYSGAAQKTAAEQISDIDASAVKDNNGTTLNDKYEFIPIANWDLHSYDAGCHDKKDDKKVVSHSIKNLTVTAQSTAADSAGKHSALFSGVNVSFNFQYVRLVDSDIEGWGNSGGLVGSAPGATFTKCSLENVTVTGWNLVGGLISHWWGDTVTDAVTFDGCEAKSLTVKSNNNTAGGLAGGGPRAIFKDCIVGKAGNAKDNEIVNITAKEYAGGLVGNLSGVGSFEECKVFNAEVTCDVAGADSEAGGLVGRTEGGAEFKSCSASDVTVKGIINAGGLVGGAENVKMGEANEDSIQGGCTAENVTVIAGSFAGGLVGNSVNGVFAECKTVKAEVTGTGGESEAGGLVGSTKGDEFNVCTTENASVTAMYYAGGLVGNSKNGGWYISCETINAKVVSVGVNDKGITSSAGGLVGFSQKGGKFITCMSINANVTGGGAASEAGGLVGKMQDSSELNGCQVYWSEPSSLTGTSDYQVTAVSAGGLIGAIVNGGEIRNSFAATLVKGTTNAGGMVGYLAGNSGTVSVLISYADCYIQAGPSGYSYASGLIGIKNSGVVLEFRDVYAAGFLSIVGEGQAAGLCGGWVAIENKYEMTATNAYAAIHYSAPYGGYPLMCTEEHGNAINCYFMESNWGWLKLTYEEMCKLNMGPMFVSQTETHPYNLDGGSRSAYPFPSLKGLPHYGDWYVPEKTVMAEPPLEEAGPGPEAGPPEQSAETGGAAEGEPSEAAPPAGDITAAEQSIPAGDPGALPPDTLGERSGRSVTKRDL